MKKFAIIAVLAITAIACYADEIEDHMTTMVMSAVKAGKADDAQKWSTALHNYRASLREKQQAHAAETANNFLDVYDNILKSGAAIAKGIAQYEERSPYNKDDKEQAPNDWRLIKRIAAIFVTLTERPLNDKDVSDAVTDIVTTEKEEVAFHEKLMKRRNL